VASPMPVGFNFRQLEAYVTDGSPDVFFNKAVTVGFASGAYSSTPGYGWSDNTATGLDAVNSSSSVNARLAGYVYIPNSSTPANAEFRVDTGAGTFNLTLALGDAISTSGPNKVEFFDGANSTAVLTVSVAAASSGEFYDANGTLHTSAANWVSNQTSKSIALANSYLRVRIGGAASGGTSLAHFSLASVPTPNPPTGVTAGSVTAFAVTASWTDASSDETGFKVQYAPSPYSSWTAFSGSPTAANATTLASGNVLTPGTSYKIRVASTNANGDSAFVESGVFTTPAFTYARPSSDITKQWTASSGTDHFAMIDEVTASDADYIGATAVGQTTEVKLQAMTAPQAGTSVAIGYRVQGITGAAGVTVSMVQGTTVIATDTNRTANGDYVLTVAPATWASVTNWTDIRLRFVST